MIEPTDEMVTAFSNADFSGCGNAVWEDEHIRIGLAAVLAIVERDYHLRTRAAAPRPRRISLVDHNADALRRARKRAGWKQFHLAKAVGISASLLCEAERGTRGLSYEVLGRIATVLGCPIVALERKP